MHASGRRVENPKDAIAICGMALRLPGGISTPEDFWSLLLSKRSGHGPIPASRFNIDGFHSTAQPPPPSTTKMRHGYFLDDAETDFRQFDTSFFTNMSRSEVERLDPQQRLLLEVVYESVEAAGEANSFRGQRIGCFVGTFGQDWGELQSVDKMSSGLYRITGQGDFLLSNRVSFEYDLKGPSFTVKTACSSSLVALHLACQALQRGECSGAVVGGTNLIVAPDMSIAMTEQGIVSADGRCKSFDASADGYGRGEAINAVYLKRLDAALAYGNPIRAVIAGTGMNCDGRSPSLASPAPEAHEALIRDTYAAAGLRVADTPLVECHATGTAVGDPLEAAAIARAFGGTTKTYMGSASVKPNVGHSEGASGITSLIKAVLALENRTIPPNINFSTPNPEIPFKEANLIVPVQPTPWPEGRPARASVNSFGLGGANAHAILEAAPPTARRNTVGLPPEQALLVFSAKHPDSLDRMVRNCRDYLTKKEDSAVSLHDVAYTLACRREQMRHRAFVITGDDRPDFDDTALIKGPSPSSAAAAAPVITMVFSGQGAQWPGMCASLLEHFSAFANAIDRMDGVLQALAEPPGWTIRGQLSNPSDRVHSAELAQPLCTAVQIGLVDLWRQAFGVRADSVVGHSSGEMAAAYAAGAIDAEQAILVAYFRGQATTTTTAGRAGAGAGGSMAAIGLGSDDVRALLVDDDDDDDAVVIACENSGASTTISGDSGAVDAVVARVRSQYPGVLARHLRVDQAYHSHHMKQCVEGYYRSLASLGSSHGKPAIPFYSTVHGRQLSSDETLDAAYWCRNLTSPVRFHGAVRHLLKHGEEEDKNNNNNNNNNNRIFIEIGPHSALAGPLRQIFRETSTNPTYIPTVVRDHDDSTRSVLAAAGRLWIQGGPVDFTALYPSADAAAVVPDLPPYPWQHAERFGGGAEEGRIAKGWRGRRAAPHELLGAAVLEWNGLAPTWRNQLKVEHVPWLAGHRVGGNVVFPGAGYVAMVGEAVRQLTGVAEYSLRDVVLASAMVLDDGDGDGVEVMTMLRRVRLTESLESDRWYEFEVSSFDGSVWTRHCWGQAGPGDPLGVVDSNAVPAERLPRQVDAAHWYKTMARVGIDYSGPFQGLSHISAHPKENVARATTLVGTEAMENRYQLHPSAMDAVIQLIAVASCRGQARLLDSVAVPTFISHLYVGGEGRSSLQLQASAIQTAGGGFTGDAAALAQGKAAFRLGGLQASPIDDGKRAATTSPPTAVELEWKPHIDFVDVGQTMRPTVDGRAGFAQLERLFFLCAVDVLERLQQGIQTPPPEPEPEPHLQKLHDWLQRHVDGVLDRGSPLFGRAERLPAAQREVEARRVYEQLLATEFHPCAVALERHRAGCVDMFAGSRAPLDVLMQDGTLHRLYDFLNAWDYGGFFELLGHAQPGLRVLEIGAGTGGTTAVMLDGLKGPDGGERLYRTYTFTDISSGFFEGARERFAAWPNVDFAVLDISQDPLAQGFEEGSYDLIIAANVLHATPSLQRTLCNVRKLLRPGNGRLLLQELCPAAKWMNFLFGTLPGWWMAEDEGRVGQDEPYIDPSCWDKELRAAGFEGVEAVVYDQPPPFHINANMVARATHTQHRHDRVTFLVGDGDGAGNLHKRLAATYGQDGLAVDWRTLADEMPEGQDIVVLLELGRPFLDEISDVRFDRLIEWVAALDGREAGVLWLTHSSQMACPDPRYAQVLGLARNIRSELSVDFATVEIDDVTDDALPETLVRLYRKFEERDRSGQWDPDFEYAIGRGVPHVGRFRWFSVEQALNSQQSTGLPESETVAKLTMDCRGLLQTLRFSAVELPALKPDEVLIEMRASGLNFKDVLIAMGIVPDNNLGLEGAGTVVKVGNAVTDFRVGDRVAAMCRDGHASHVVTKAMMCVRIPDDLSFRQAATMPVVYTTAIRALLHVGRLVTDQTVLIHSACGGVGIAAIQICQTIGAKIFATVGSDEKRDYLTDNFGIPASCIFDSRSPSFARAVMDATHGQGVDLVLNSLSGELLHQSWACVAEFGTLVEIGKRDLIGRGQLGLRPFEENRTYAAVDLSHICLHRKDIVKSLLEKTISLYRSGSIAPIEPVKVFEAGQAEEAYRFMQKGTHIGKIVLEMPEEAAELRPAAKKRELRLRPDAAYIITGGLGGLGKATARMMVESGARHLIFISRSGRTTAPNDAFLSELEAAGCEPIAVAGSVQDEATVRQAVKQAGRPVAGVVHAAMVLQDCATRVMKHKAWQAVLGPRITGAWNLHNALLDAELDFFVLFSSLGGIVGQQGQANYAASNTFLDAFVRYRHALGLPASAIDIGPVEDVGYVAQSASILRQMRTTHAFTLREKDVLEAVELAIARSVPPKAPRKGTGAVSSVTDPSIFGVGLRANKRLDDPTTRLIWRRDVRMARYADLEDEGGEGTTASNAHQNRGLKEFLSSASADPAMLDEDSTVDFLGREIGRTVSRYLMRPEDEVDAMPLDRSLASLGVDSLVSIEIRNWCRQQLGFESSVLEISKSTLAQLAKHAVDALRAKNALINGEVNYGEKDEARKKWDEVLRYKAP